MNLYNSWLFIRYRLRTRRRKRRKSRRNRQQKRKRNPRKPSEWGSSEINPLGSFYSPSKVLFPYLHFAFLFLFYFFIFVLSLDIWIFFFFSFRRKNSGAFCHQISCPLSPFDVTSWLTNFNGISLLPLPHTVCTRPPPPPPHPFFFYKKKSLSWKFSFGVFNQGSYIVFQSVKQNTKQTNKKKRVSDSISFCSWFSFSADIRGWSNFVVCTTLNFDGLW